MGKGKPSRWRSSGGDPSSVLRATPFAVAAQECVTLLPARSSRAAPVLSAAEAHVVRLILEDLTNAQIARERGTSERTVANQIAGVFRKVAVGSRAELVAWTIEGSVQTGVRGRSDGPADWTMLSACEYQVAALAALGYTNKRTSYALGVSPSMVSKHLRTACSKLGARNRAEMIRTLWAQRAA